MAFNTAYVFTYFAMLLFTMEPGLFSSPYAIGYDNALSGLRALM